jgi:hypothetical protein
MDDLNELSDLERLFRVLTFIAPLSGALRSRFEHFVTRRSYPKKFRLLEEGTVSRHIYFIRQGAARAFFHDRDGHEHTCWFFGKCLMGIDRGSWQLLPKPAIGFRFLCFS